MKTRNTSNVGRAKHVPFTRSVSWLVVWLAAIVALLLQAPVLIARAAPPPPPYTTSYYMNTVDPNALYNMGCDLGSHDLNTDGTQDNVVILFFGGPAQQSGAYGVWLFGNNQFVSTSQIAEAVKQFGRGYWECTGSDTASIVRIAIGTSNYGGYVTYGHGSAWAQLVNDVGSYLDQNGYSSQSLVRGASDMELNWNSAAVTKSWVDGYASANRYFLYDFGDAAGCPEYSQDNGWCNNGWRQDDVSYISWGAAPSYPFPQQYNTVGAQARQWYRLSLYSYSYKGSRMSILGALTQYQACQQVGDCYGTDNTPATGWSQLWDALNSDSRTAQELPWSTDIKWH